MAKFDVVVIGGGAAGMMCAIEAGKRGRSVVVLEHNAKVGEKIRISGGGRCNFTNSGTSFKKYLSANPKFAISALSRYTQKDFIALVNKHNITWHEKTLGQLFCDDSATQIIEMLRDEMGKYGVKVRTKAEVHSVDRIGRGFVVNTSSDDLTCESLIVACGGKSIPKMGASNLGYKLAEQFDIPVTETAPALVPLTFDPDLLNETKELSGIAVDAKVSCGKTSFREAMLFTHRGLSGPSILQISSYWSPGDIVEIDMAPDLDAFEMLRDARKNNGKQDLLTVLVGILPRRLAVMVAGEQNKRLGDLGDKVLREVAGRVNRWQVKPTGSEGYRTAEVTLGGVDTKALDAKTLEAKNTSNLYFVGEIVDVTGWLGGYNFQWAWSSGWAAGQVA